MTKVIFLDRDGVINKYPGDRNYVTSLKGFRFIRGAKKALRRLSQAGYTMFVISNQAGVTKGLYSGKTLDDITRTMLKKLATEKAYIQGVYYCIHREEDNCACRKPKTGLIEKAILEHKIPKLSLKRSFFIGDTQRDIQAGKESGCRTIMVFSGKEKIANQKDWEFQPDFTAKDLSHAADIILNE
ncbi:MAG: HAD family hydrolase, partial [Candidatus Omnitrophica bacterium]|nr:HAD family hydrolase [Candidatus Omnitrophota bacterium]